MQLLDEDKEIMRDLVNRYNVCDILMYIYWLIVDRKDLYVKNNPHGHTRKKALIDLANKIDETMEFARSIGE